jgi:5'-nucleotidase
MIIAITDDDGYTEGVEILLDAANEIGKAYAILPERQRSAISIALTLHKPLRLTHIKKNVYTLNGNPADCTLFAIHSKEFQKPDVIFSGINWGDNCGLSPLISSGTIGACWKAAIYKVPAIAFSVHRPHRRLGWEKKENWDREGLKDGILRAWAFLKSKLKKGDFYVVNFPEERYIKKAKIVFSKRRQWMRTFAVIEKRKDPHGNPYYWLSGKSIKPEKGTDYYELVARKNIVITKVALEKLLE